MDAFKKDTTNIEYNDGFIQFIITQLIICSNKMKDDCAVDDSLFVNDERNIANRLVAEYLNATPNIYRYIGQTQESFCKEIGHFTGLADIRVIGNDYFYDDQAYYIIECKRIDGTSSLNREYVKEGVSRFLYPLENPKYPSYYRQNIMFGFVVKVIDIPDNTEKIDKLQATLLNEVKTTHFELKQSDNSQYFLFSCLYQSSYIGQIELMHLFYNFADVIRND